MKILVVCGAGASSTFVAQRLRRAAMLAGLDWQTSAGAETSVSAAHADLVLIGPHLADRVDVIRSATTAQIALLPDDVFRDREGTQTLSIAEAALSGATSDSPSPAKSTAKGRS
ncbi:PTS sugar transporter subunit IIB [Microbacterium sp. A196]|uniref:PTS sugar transporter subunit IIB n=1 Tax=unclassified Microbacterium TaxID=2609290 RepID=UPI003FD314A0